MHDAVMKGICFTPHTKDAIPSLTFYPVYNHKEPQVVKVLLGSTVAFASCLARRPSNVQQHHRDTRNQLFRVIRRDAVFSALLTHHGGIHVSVMCSGAWWWLRQEVSSYAAALI